MPKYTSNLYGRITIRARCLLLPLFLCAASNDFALATERHLRPMLKNELADIGLVVWTEMNPQWIVETTSMKGRQIFTAQTPLATYPPAAFTFASFKHMRIAMDELKSTAVTVMKSARRNYHSEVNDSMAADLVASSYGNLIGYESTFQGIADGIPVDVKVFLGQVDGEAPVLLQAYTLRGKLSAISENIRRSWSNVAYLE